MIVLSETKKVPIFFILLNNINFDFFLNYLDFDKVDLIGVLTENSDMRINLPSGREVVVGSFADLDAFLQYADQDIYWILYGFQSHLQDISKFSEVLQASGVRKE